MFNQSEKTAGLLSDIKMGVKLNHRGIVRTQESKRDSTTDK